MNVLLEKLHTYKNKKDLHFIIYLFVIYLVIDQLSVHFPKMNIKTNSKLFTSALG